MTSPADRDQTFVAQAVAEISAVRPAYLSLLAFYGPVFVSQAEAAGDTHPPPIPVDASELAIKRESGAALIAPAAFTVDTAAAKKLLQTVCRIAADTGEKLSGTATAISSAMADGLDVAPLFSDALDENRQTEALAGKLEVPAPMLSLLLHLALRPSIAAGVRELTAHLDDEPADRPDCPICGSPPILGELDDNGGQWLHCRLCWHRWTTRRITCPACGNRDAKILGYLYSDQEAEYRVSLCDACRHYLKVVDTRQLKRPFFPPLEQVVTLHLDMLMSEKGYTAQE